MAIIGAAGAGLALDAPGPQLPSGMYERPPEEDADEVAGAGAEVANDIGALAAISAPQAQG